MIKHAETNPAGRIFAFALFALCGCGYVHVYNAFETSKVLMTKSELVNCARIFLSVAPWMYTVPISGLFASFAAYRSPSRRFWYCVPDLLIIFTIGWSALAILVWQIQQPPVPRFPSDR
jgi:hypothetical protein